MIFSKLPKIFAQDYYAIPDYQRDYEWGPAQNSTLLEDIISMISEDIDTTHFIGAIVTIPFEEDSATNISIDLKSYGIANTSVKHLVDGQQRLTSISVFTQALLDCIEQDTELDDKQKLKQTDKLKSILKGNEWNDNDEKAPKMILNGNTGNYYNKEILKESTKSASKIFRGAKRLSACYELFYKEIPQQKSSLINHGICKDANEFYKRISDVITKQIVLVEIECEKSSNAFQVFDSLNGKGLDLTAADRIKNIMLSWSPKGKGAQKWDALVASVGEEYLTSFFVSLFYSTSGKRIAKNKLPDEFKKKYKDSAIQDFNYFFTDILKKGEIYGKLRVAKTDSNNANELIKDILQLKSDQSFVLLFSTLAHYGMEIINSKEYLHFLNTLITLIVRMQICEKSTNRLDVVFSDCIHRINDASASIDVITKVLKDYTKKLVSDSEFKAGFEKFSTTDNKIAEYYLRKIEIYLRQQGGDRTPVERNLTVEHIIPKTLDDISNWYGKTTIPEEISADFKNLVVERLGNKALLYGDDNSSASNNNYKKKLQIYENGKQGQNKGTPVKTFCLIVSAK